MREKNFSDGFLARMAAMVVALFAALIFMAVSSVCVHAADQHPEPGTEFGTGCRWAIDGDGVLWIWPTDGVSGVLPDYTSQSSWPWYSRRMSVKKVVVEDGVKTGSFCRGMFYGMNKCAEMQVEKLDVSSATSMANMFYNCSSLTSLPIESWDVSAVKSMDHMFYNCSSLTSLPVGAWDVGAVTNMNYMFSLCHSLTSLPVENWDVAAVTNMFGLFYGCSSLTSLPVENWDVSAVTDMYSMFSRCGSLTSLPVENWDVGAVTSIGCMFYGCSSLIGLPVENWDVGSVTSMYQMFYNCISLTSLPVENWDVGTVMNMDYMFSGCSSLVSLPVENWDVGAVTNMSNMFDNCGSLVSLPVQNWDVGDVSDMSDMFLNCTSLMSLPLGNWDVSSVWNMNSMFQDCSSLENLDLSKFATASIATSNMLSQCSSLSSVILGENFNFRDNNVLPAPPTDITTGMWIKEDETAGPLTAEQLYDQYNAHSDSWNGKWIWQMIDTTAMVNFDANGGYTSQQQITQKDTFTPITIPEATRPTYYLVEWNTKKDGTGIDYQPGDSFTPTGGSYTTFYAIWDYAVECVVSHHQQNIEQNGYDLVEAESVYAKPNTVVTPEPKHYPGFITPPAQSIDLADEKSPGIAYYYDRTHYAIRYDGNGATSGTMDEVLPMTGGISKKLHDNKFQRDGYVFMGWNTSSDGSGTFYGDAQTVVNVAEDGETAVMYAQWISMEKNAETEYSNATYRVKLKSGETILIPDLPANTEYSFEEIDNPGGWVKSGESGTNGTVSANRIKGGSVTNSYNATGSASIVAHKKLIGGELAPGEFTFGLWEGNDASVIQNEEPLLIAGNGNLDVEEEILLEDGETVKNPFYGLSKISFDDIKYTVDDIGEHTYFIMEGAWGADDVEFDTHIETVRVTVSDAGNGTLTTDVQYDADGAVFTNTVKPVIEEDDPVRINDIHITKQMADGESAGPFEFRVLLTDNNGTPLTNSYDVNIVNSTDKNSFSMTEKQTITKISRTENIDENGTKLYDYGDGWNNSNIVNHVVQIPGAASLHIAMTYGIAEEGGYCDIWEGAHPDYNTDDNYETAIADLTNSGNEEYTIQGNAVTFGFNSYSIGSGDKYGFYAIVTGEVEVKTINHDVILSTTSITSGDTIQLMSGQTAILTGLPVGVHYKIEEILPEESNYELASAENTEGVLTDGEPPEAVFTNICTATGSFTPQVTKVYNGGNLAEESFTFELYDDTGSIIDTATTDSTGTVIFKPIDYSPSDIGQTFHYTVREQPGDDPDVQYDEHIEDINVVVNTGTGADLDIRATYSTGGVFTNARMFEANISKQAGFGLTGDNITGATLTITDPNGAPIQTITTDGSPLYATMLPPGDYILKETTTPTGYKTAEDIPFTVTATGTIEINSEAADTITMIDEIDGHDLSITKRVRGNFGDKHQEFSFKVTFTTPIREVKVIKNNAESAEAIKRTGQTFTLKHGETITFKNLPAGTEYVIEETKPADYTMTSTNASGTIAAENITATFTNTRQGAVPTSTIPIGMSAAVLAGGAVIIAARNKKKS